MAERYLKIKTKLDNSQTDKDISKLEEKIKKLNSENVEKQQQQTGIQSEINKYEELTQKADEYKFKIDEIKNKMAEMKKMDPSLVVGSSAEYTDLETKLNSINQKYRETTNEIDKQAPKIEKLYSKLDDVKQKQIENNEKINEYKTKIDSINATKLSNEMSNVGNGLTGMINKLSRVLLSIYGIRTGINGIRSAIALVSQYDTQVAANLEYIRFALAQAIKPIVEIIVKLLFTAMAYISALLKGWFGINIFSNATAKNFAKMQKSARGTAKSAKELQKTLARFDEANVLNDSGGTNNNSGTGVASPDFDLSNIDSVKIPDWLQWIIDNKEIVLGFFAGLAALIAGIKIAEFVKGLGDLVSGFSLIKALGIGLIFLGIYETISGILNYLKDPSWKNFGNIILGIGIAISGLAILIGSVPLAIAGAITMIISVLVSNWSTIKGWFQKAIDWLTDSQDWLTKNLGSGLNLAGNMIIRSNKWSDRTI